MTNIEKTQLETLRDYALAQGASMEELQKEAKMMMKDPYTTEEDKKQIAEIFKLVPSNKSVEVKAPERKLSAPAKYPLIELLQELKYGRNSDDQKQLQKWIDELKRLEEIKATNYQRIRAKIDATIGEIVSMPYSYDKAANIQALREFRKKYE